MARLNPLACKRPTKPKAASDGSDYAARIRGGTFGNGRLKNLDRLFYPWLRNPPCYKSEGLTKATCSGARAVFDDRAKWGRDALRWSSRSCTGAGEAGALC